METQRQAQQLLYILFGQKALGNAGQPEILRWLSVIFEYPKKRNR